jgi:hypothetical protein
LGGSYALFFSNRRLIIERMRVESSSGGPYYYISIGLAAIGATLMGAGVINVGVGIAMIVIGAVIGGANYAASANRIQKKKEEAERAAEALGPVEGILATRKDTQQIGYEDVNRIVLKRKARPVGSTSEIRIQWRGGSKNMLFKREQFDAVSSWLPQLGGMVNLFEVANGTQRKVSPGEAIHQKESAAKNCVKCGCELMYPGGPCRRCDDVETILCPKCGRYTPVNNHACVYCGATAN